ncbi:MAG: alpha/beta hydrolase, partial [Alphaproteobacteria bacterium]
MFEGFRTTRIATSGAAINLRIGGDGRPVLLLHGYPQSHVMWHKVAPGLARHFTVVAPDLRGYGDSSTPPSGADHGGYSKRAMARDQVEVMAKLGFPSFALVGHDRGARVAQRLALDHPGRVERLVVLDVVPTHEVFAHVDARLA